jgi:transposase InsO family protein
MEHDRESRWALWRFSVLGPLVSSRLEHGDRLAYLREAAERLHINPAGAAVKIPLRTLEAWYYAWKKGGLSALKRVGRHDRGRTRIPERLQERLVALKLAKPRRSIRRLIRLLERSKEARKGELSRSGVQRFLCNRGLSARGGLGEPIERRSFRHQEPGDLWMGDVLHGPLVLWGKRLRKSYVIAFIDSATRFVPAAEVRLSEGAADHEYALKQAILKHGPPRALYLDNGAAQSSYSLKLITAELSIELLHTQAYDPQAKGAIERWNRTFREEVEDELPEEPLPLEELQSRAWAWLSVEYNARVHTTTGRIPREDWLREPSPLRRLPPGIDLDEIFLHRERRVVRRDGTVRFHGLFLEVRSALVGKEVELRFDPFEPDALPRVYLQGKFVCDTTRLDPVKNSTRKRHRPPSRPEAKPGDTGDDPLGLMQEEQLGRAAPPGSQDQDDDDDDNDQTQEVSHV